MRPKKDITVTFYPPLYSMLIYDCLSVKNGLEGILLGEVTQNNVTVMHDKSIVEEQSRTVHVTSFIPFRKIRQFYNNAGELRPDAIRSYFNGRDVNVVGWFKYHKRSTNQLTFRQAIIHGNLMRAYPNQHDLFVHMNATSSVKDSGATNEFLPGFYTTSEDEPLKFQEIPFEILSTTETSGYYTTKMSTGETYTKEIETEIDKQLRENTLENYEIARPDLYMDRACDIIKNVIKKHAMKLIDEIQWQETLLSSMSVEEESQMEVHVGRAHGDAVDPLAIDSELMKSFAEQSTKNHSEMDMDVDVLPDNELSALTNSSQKIILKRKKKN